MEKFNQACRLMETKDIASLRKAIELFEASEVESTERQIEQCKKEIHGLYEARRKKKLYKKIAVLGAVAFVIIILIIIYSTFMGKIRARELEIFANFEGLEFYGELSSEQEKDGILWLLDEKTLFTFNKGGTITHDFVYDRVNKNDPTSDPQHSETQFTISPYEVFINTKGDVFLHIEHSLFPVLVDENDMPYEIQKYNGKTLTIKK